jgi:hypothetical protein
MCCQHLPTSNPLYAHVLSVIQPSQDYQESAAHQQREHAANLVMAMDIDGC